MSQKVYLWILKIGVVASFLCVFFVFKNFLFPYITSKQIPFNILMEVLFIFWLAFIIKFPQWSPFKGFSKTWPIKFFVKPKQPAAVEAAPVVEIKNKNNKKNNFAEPAPALAPLAVAQLVTFGLFAFFAVILISCFTGVDFQMSFWSNAERMLGVYHILHFFVLYLITITVFRDWRDWQIIFTALFLAATGVAMGSLPAGANVYGTLGNSLYAAVFMIFAFYFILLLFFHKEGSDDKKGYSFLKFFYFLAIPFLYLQFAKVNKAGETVGLLMGVASFVFLLGIISKRKVWRVISWIVVAAIIGLIASALIFHASPLIAKNKFLSRINTNRATFQTRLLSWESGAKDFHNHWLLGTGFGNYAIIFDKYFNPKFYDYAKSETYFDRAHNNIVDLTSTTGILGILSYLSVLAAAVFYLIRAYRRGRIKPVEFCLLISLLVAYFVQNLDVFDSFVSYLCLMIVLAYITWLSNTNQDRGNTRALLAAGGKPGFPDREIFALIGAGLLAVFLIYNYAILPIKTFTGVIQGQTAFGQGQLVTGGQIYQEALANNTPLDRDSRGMLERAVANYAWNISKLNQADAAAIIALAIEKGEINVSYNPSDSMGQMELARVYDVGYKVMKDPKLQEFYGQAALEHIDKSIAASPARVPVYFIKSQIQLAQNKIDEAIGTLEYAAVISKVFPEAYCQLAQVYLIKKNQLKQEKTATSTIEEMDAKAWSAMDICLTNNAADNLAITEIIKEAINHYTEQSNLDYLIQLYEQLTQYESNAQYFKNLALLYQQKGDIAKAVSAAQQAAKIDPSLQTDVNAFIKQLQNQ